MHTCNYSSEPAETTGECRLAVTVPTVAAAAVAGSHHMAAACTAEVAAVVRHLHHTFPVMVQTAADRVGKREAPHVTMYCTIMNIRILTQHTHALHHYIYMYMYMSMKNSNWLAHMHIYSRRAHNTHYNHIHNTTQRNMYVIHT